MRHYQSVDVKRNSFFKAAKGMLFSNFERSELSQGVGPTMSDYARSDARTRQDVIDELQSELTIDAAAVEVHVKSGVVTLTGSAEGVGDTWLIESAARRIAGVRGLAVELAVIVPEPGMRTDDDIRRDCEHALGLTVPGANHAIKVMVSSGWVTLSGSVAWGYERWSAEDIVSQLMGVNGVNGQIKVDPISVAEDANAFVESDIKL
jgi:osmotically-inducible protein OsmY